MQFRLKTQAKANHNPNQKSGAHPRGANYFAMLQLAALHTLVPLLGVCALLALVQGGVAFWCITQGGSYVTVFYALAEHPLLCGSYFIALAGVVTWCSCCYMGKPNVGFLLGRLRLPLSHIAFIWCAHTALCLLVLWGIQVILLYSVYCFWQSGVDSVFYSNQTFFLDCYRCDFLHSILPLGDWLLWVRNLLCGLCLSLCSGVALCASVRGKQSKFFLAALLFAVWSMFQSTTIEVGCALFVYAVASAHAIFVICTATLEEALK